MLFGAGLKSQAFATKSCSEIHRKIVAILWLLFRWRRWTVNWNVWLCVWCSHSLANSARFSLHLRLVLSRRSEPHVECFSDFVHYHVFLFNCVFPFHLERKQMAQLAERGDQKGSYARAGVRPLLLAKACFLFFFPWFFADPVHEARIHTIRPHLSTTGFLRKHWSKAWEHSPWWTLKG